METHLGAEPFVGFRIFRVNEQDNTLMSFTPLGKHSPWLPGQIMESVCSHVPQHGPQPPHLNCTCGFWSVKSRRDLVRAYPSLAQRVMNQWKRERHFRESEAKKHKPIVGHRIEMDVAIQNFLTGLAGMQGTLVALGGSGSKKSPLVFVHTPKTRGKYGGELTLLVSARVNLWGVVQEHERGYRAQYAQIIPETIRWWPRQGAWFKPAQLRHIIDKYTVATEGGEHIAANDLSEEQDYH